MYPIPDKDDSPLMHEFNISNSLLGDRAALDAAWERDGYWFFRDVLDKEVIDQVRSVYLSVLNQLGVIDNSVTDADVYNGSPLINYPITMGGDPKIDPLFALYPRDILVSNPSVRRFFADLFGDEPFWVPN